MSLFVDPASSAEADAILSDVFGEPQAGSFRQRLSAVGTEPATALGALARGLTDDQVSLLQAQEIITVIEQPWSEALTSQSLVPIIPEAN